VSWCSAEESLSPSMTCMLFLITLAAWVEATVSPVIVISGLGLKLWSVYVDVFDRYGLCQVQGHKLLVQL